MRNLVAIVAALGCLSAPALAQAPAQGAAPALIPLYPDSVSPDSEGIIIPTGSRLTLASFERDSGVTAKFSGRFELTGTYELESDGEYAFVTIWPDEGSIDKLPYWNDRGGPERIFINDGWRFAEAVLSKDDLAKLKAGALSPVRGRTTIVADEYETSIECDAANFSARFVSVVNTLEVAAADVEHGEC